MRIVLLSVSALVLLVGSGGVLGVPIFEDQFDGAAYVAGSYLSAVEGSPWTIADGCNDGRVSTNNPFTAPNTITDYKDGDTNLRLGYRNRHDLTTAEMLNASLVHDPNPTCIDGTDENPLVFTFKMYLGPKKDNVYYDLLNVYAELSCGDDRAPTPMLTAICSESKIRPHLDLDGDGQYHSSIAVGQIAWADTNPCDIPSSEVAQNFRLTVYDGRQWRILQTPVDMHTCGAHNYVTLTIKTNTSDIALSTMYNGTDCTGPRQVLTTTIVRQYLGQFTAIKMGNIPDEETGGCWGEDKGSVGYPNQETVIDDVLLTDGEAFNIPNPCQVIPRGACCIAHACNPSMTEAACTAAGGTYKGDGTACEPDTCCPTPFADADEDGDVDQTDFAFLQLCYTGAGPASMLPGCKCFDREPVGTGDDDIDENDRAAFEECASGPGIPASLTCG